MSFHILLFWLFWLLTFRTCHPTIVTERSPDPMYTNQQGMPGTRWILVWSQGCGRKQSNLSCLLSFWNMSVNSMCLWRSNDKCVVIISWDLLAWSYGLVNFVNLPARNGDLLKVHLCLQNEIKHAFVLLPVPSLQIVHKKMHFSPTQYPPQSLT